MTLTSCHDPVPAASSGARAVCSLELAPHSVTAWCSVPWAQTRATASASRRLAHSISGYGWECLTQGVQTAQNKAFSLTLPLSRDVGLAGG